MTLYRERLWPTVWMYLATALVIPAALLVFLPINPAVGAATAIVLYAACVVLLLAASPTISVSSERLTAGAATLPIALIGAVTAFSGSAATAQRGPELDARAWLLIRGWISPVVSVEVLDERDPVPYWLISTRHPDRFVAAIERARAA